MPEPSFRQVAVPALLCTGAATSLVWAGLARSGALHVPPAVAYLVAAILAAAAAALLAKAARRPRVVDWLVVGILACFTVVGGWVALDTTPGACRGGVEGLRLGGGAFGCRTAFALGAVMNAGFTAWAARLALRGKHGSGVRTGEASHPDP
jgi:hypothetical protein